MKNSIDEEIEIVEDLANTHSYINYRERVALGNVLTELKTYKKIAEKLAEVVDLGCIDVNCSPMCIHDNCIKECALDWARKEVKANEEK